MSTTTRYERRPSTDSWSLRIMREAKADRDAAGESIPELDEHLAWSEQCAAETGTQRAATPAPEEDAATTRRRGDAVASGARGGSTANAPTPAQLRFLASLHADLGTEVPTARDKRHASLLIDKAKTALDAARRSGKAPAAAAPVRLATERQRELIANLLTERAYDADVDVDALSVKAASELIDALFSAPRAKVAAHGIREGRYAYTTDGGATADHYRVRRDGKIVVWTAGGEWPYTGKLNEGLEWIKANPREAAELFGRLTETCGRCGRDLSDDDSRARGLGPVCAGKSEW
jgi:hypothetical protein